MSFKSYKIVTFMVIVMVMAMPGSALAERVQPSRPALAKGRGGAPTPAPTQPVPPVPLVPEVVAPPRAPGSVGLRTLEDSAPARGDPSPPPGPSPRISPRVLLGAEIALGAGIALGAAAVGLGLWALAQDGRGLCHPDAGATQCPRVVDGPRTLAVDAGVGGAVMLASAAALVVIELGVRRSGSSSSPSAAWLLPAAWRGGVGLSLGGAW